MSRRAKESASIAKTVKISTETWEMLRKLKMVDLTETSYSNVVVIMYDSIKNAILNKNLKVDIEKFAHTNLPENSTTNSKGVDEDEGKYPKTVVISMDAHKILMRIKYEFNLKTLSDALDLLIEEYSLHVDEA